MSAKKPLESKKFVMAAIALGFGAFVYITTFVGILCAPHVAPHLGTLSMTVYGLITLVAGAGITGQSFIDMKHGTNVNVTGEFKHERREEEAFIQITQEELEADSDVPPDDL